MVADAFEKMAQPGFWQEVSVYLGGYATAGGVDMALDKFTQREIPDELSGVLAVGGLQYAPVVSGNRMRQMQVGAAAYSAEALAHRLGIVDAIEGAL